MKSRPILFTATMIRALLDGRKSQTRRIVKDWNIVRVSDRTEFCDRSPYPLSRKDRGDAAYVELDDGRFVGLPCPYGGPGDLLWVKESWAYRLDCDHLNGTQLYERGVRQAWYWADGPGKTCRTGCAGAAGRVRAARFMPRWASRLTLKITEVRVQRLQEISEEGALAEGVSWEPGDQEANVRKWGTEQTARMRYADLWDHINGPGSWEANPWVWAISFEVIKKNVDAVLQ